MSAGLDAIRQLMVEMEKLLAAQGESTFYAKAQAKEGRAFAVEVVNELRTGQRTDLMLLAALTLVGQGMSPDFFKGFLDQLQVTIREAAR